MGAHLPQFGSPAGSRSSGDSSSRRFFPFGPAAAPAAAPPPSQPTARQIRQLNQPVNRSCLANLSPGLADIIRLAQAHVDENVILAFIHNSSQTYSPTADEILYLSDLGLSQTVIAALFKQKPPAQPEIAATAGPTPVALAKLPSPNAPLAAPGANAGLFCNALAPYGTWTQVPDYGLCWQPATETLNPDWRPYVGSGPAALYRQRMVLAICPSRSAAATTPKNPPSPLGGELPRLFESCLGASLGAVFQP